MRSRRSHPFALAAQDQLPRVNSDLEQRLRLPTHTAATPASGMFGALPRRFVFEHWRRRKKIALQPFPENSDAVSSALVGLPLDKNPHSLTRKLGADSRPDEETRDDRGRDFTRNRSPSLKQAASGAIEKQSAGARENCPLAWKL